MLFDMTWWILHIYEDHSIYMGNNTSLNKSQVWYIDDGTNEKSIKFLLSTNLQMVQIKIWAQSDYQFTNYSYLNEATIVNFQNNGKNWISCVDKALLSDGKKILFEQSNSLISVFGLLSQKQWLRGGMLSLFSVIWQMIAEHSGHPNSAVVPENTKKLH